MTSKNIFEKVSIQNQIIAARCRIDSSS